MRRTQQPPHASRRDVRGGDLPADCFPGRGLCCPDDPLDLVLQLSPPCADDRAPPPPSSLAALGIGAGGGEPVIKQEPESPPRPLAETAFVGGGGGGGLPDSWGLSNFVLEGLGLCTGLDEVDVDMFFADDDAPDGGGEATTQGKLLCDTKPPAHMAASAAGGPAPVHTRGSLGGAVVPNDASPLPAPVPAGAFPLQAYDACGRAFDGAVSKNASAAPATAAPVSAGRPLPFYVTNNGTPIFSALIMPPAAAPAPMPPPAPAHMPAGAAPPFLVTNNRTPTMPALITPAAAAAPAPMPLPAAGLHACAALPGIVSNIAPAPSPLMAPMAWPARALQPNAATLAGVYSCTKAPPSAAPSSSSPRSRASSGPSSATSSETEFLQPHHAWVVPRKPRSAPPVNRRKRPWVLDFPLHALPPVALPPPANPGGDDDHDDGNDDDAKNRNAAALTLALALPPPGNAGADNDSAAAGGIRRRRPAPRQRNRQAQRVCSHCHSPETPQWRAGPDGPGTLCNACGIRYAANRLLPEYRPSTAPSFRSGQHSNRHRKVMKLREQQMMMAATEEKPPPPSEQQPPMEEDGGAEKEDDGFMGVCEYISAAGFL